MATMLQCGVDKQGFEGLLRVLMAQCAASTESKFLSLSTGRSCCSPGPVERNAGNNRKSKGQSANAMTVVSIPNCRGQRRVARKRRITPKFLTDQPNLDQLGSISRNARQMLRQATAGLKKEPEHAVVTLRDKPIWGMLDYKNMMSPIGFETRH